MIKESIVSRETWCPLNHCGNWAERVAKVAGIQIDLPWYDFDRPGAVGKYLRDHGGITSGSNANVNSPTRQLSITAINLSGNWRQQTEPRALLQISQIGQQVRAIKIQGDPSHVPFGAVSFQGTFSSNPFTVQWQYALEGYQDPYWQPAQVEVKDTNTFVAQGAVWKREPPLASR
jgi:hypothetical protein